ncbi:Ku protein, partial [Streptomyces sp. NPDC101234]|uniref:Ku protein n=1 Tax=Streptomyces sp. NPDC101234 TaxID=3366138 RepID=UPI003817E44D
MTIPVQLYAAVEEHTVWLYETHTADGSGVQHRRFCAAEGREISYSEVGRGVALPDGRTLPLTEDDPARLPLPTKRTITVVGFIDPKGIIPISYDQPYYVAPAEGNADRPYALLVEALSRTGLVAMAKVTIRSRERKAVVRTGGDPLFLTCGIPCAQALRRCGHGQPSRLANFEEPPQTSAARRGSAATSCSASRSAWPVGSSLEEARIIRNCSHGRSSLTAERPGWKRKTLTWSGSQGQADTAPSSHSHR